MKKIFAFFSKYLFANLSEDFAWLFFKKEGRVLMGKNFSNFIFLVIIFLITFFALGFAKGSLRYLHGKMDDPFIKWVSIDIPYSQADNLDEIIKQLKEDNTSQLRYHYQNVTGYGMFSLAFWDKEQANPSFFTGRTIEMGNPMLNVILKDSNLIYGRSFENPRDLGLIVTVDLLKKLGYANGKPAFVIMAFPDKVNEDNFFKIPLPLIAVVKELPGKASFVTTPFLYQQRNMPVSSYNPFDPEITPHIEFLTEEKERRANAMKERIEKIVKDNPEFAGYNPIVFISPYVNSFFPCFQIQITINPDTSVSLRNKIFDFVANDKEIKKFKFCRYSDYTTKVKSSEDMKFPFDRLLVEFTSLDKVKDFQNFLSKKHEIRMDMVQVESLENYNFIANLTQIISIILMIFSVLSIILFLTNLLKNHLERIKMNIGTFKAFGIHHRSLEKIYLSIIFSFILVTVVISYLINVTIGSLGGVRFVLKVFRSPVEPGEHYFDLFNTWTLTALLLVLVASYYALKYTTRKIFRQTPGDLIYDRQDSGRKGKEKA